MIETNNMEKLTYKEILQKLQNEGIELCDLAYGDFDSVELGLGESSEQEQDYDGSCWWSTRHFIDHDVYIKVEGDRDGDGDVYFDEYEKNCTHVNSEGEEIA